VAYEAGVTESGIALGWRRNRNVETADDRQKSQLPFGIELHRDRNASRTS